MRRSAQMGAFMKKEINVEIGGRIRRQREALHMSREQLAEAADISTPFLADVELGRKGVSPLTIRKMCNALHVSADYLIRNKELSSDFPEIIYRHDEDGGSSYLYIYGYGGYGIGVYITV